MPDPGSTVGRYTIIRELARGGMATVYLARQPDLDRDIALKELSSFHALDPAMAERFSREARVAAALAHPSIVTVFEFFEHDGLPYIAMEFLERGSLRPLARSLSLPQIAGVLEGILAALAHADAHGVVHRDMKPENVLITPDGRVKIADFGVAKAYNRLWTAQFPTATGMALGTPTYMAPEQAMGEGVGPWTDLYATGVVAYELLCGRPPFLNPEEPLAVLMRHVTEPVPPLRSMRPEIDERLAAWVESMLAKAPAERPHGAAEAWSQLEDIIVELAGPMWRREARLLHEGEAAERPLTPAPFEEGSAEGYVSHGEPPSALAPAVPPRAPTPSPAARAPVGPRRLRGRHVAAGLAVIAIGAGATAVLLGGGEDAPSTGPTTSAVDLPACFDTLLEGHTRADVITGLDNELGDAAAADGRPLALVLTTPKLLGVLTVTYRARKPQDFFQFGELRDARCRKLSPTLYGAGTLPNILSYDGVRARFGGVPYAAAIAQEGGKLDASLTQLPEPELAVTSATIEGSRVVVVGTIAADAGDELTVELLDPEASGGRVRRRETVAPANGDFEVKLRLPRDLRGTPGARIRVSYPGDDTYAAQTGETVVAQ